MYKVVKNIGYTTSPIRNIAEVTGSIKVTLINSEKSK